MSEEQWVHVGPEIPLKEPDQPFNSHILQNVRSLGEKVMLINGETDETATGSQLLTRSVGVALQLREHGVRPGDIVTTALDNCFESSYTLLGTFFAGAIFAPINPDLDVDDTRKLLKLLEPRMVMCVPRSVAKITGAVSPDTPVIAVQDDNPKWEAFVNPSPSAVASFKEYSGAQLEDILCIVCSSGTTGPPKGVMHSHRLWYHLAQIFETFWNVKTTKDDISIQVTPNFWLSGLSMNILNALSGRPAVVYKTFNTRKFLEAIEKYKVTTVTVSPPHVAAIAKFPDVEKYDVSSIRDFLYGGASLSPKLKVVVENRLKKKLTEGYGQTECLNGIVPVPDTPPGSVGKVSANAVVKIVDTETGKVLGPNTEGEIWIKSVLSFSGYYKNPESTAEILDKDGWIHTGDVGYFDEDGYFYVLDRYKELIKFRGFYMAPAEVEGILTARDEVKDAAVVGIEHDEDQEHPIGFVVLQEGHSISEEKLRGIVNEPLPLYKKLQAMHFIDQIPRTASGKIQRRLLRQRARQLVNTAQGGARSKKSGHNIKKLINFYEIVHTGNF